MAPIRRGGQATTLTGDLVTWSQAEGDRGTRWRESLERDGAVVRALLLEVSPAGRATRLEMTARAGLLTLHPEPDESAIHGNVVSGGGVRHLAFGWSPDHELLVLGSPASATITLRRLASHVAVGAHAAVDVLRIDDALEPRPACWIFERVADRGWLLRDTDGQEERRLTVDGEGRPVLPGEVTWPLET